MQYQEDFFEIEKVKEKMTKLINSEEVVINEVKRIIEESKNNKKRRDLLSS